MTDPGVSIGEMLGEVFNRDFLLGATIGLSILAVGSLAANTVALILLLSSI